MSIIDEAAEIIYWHSVKRGIPVTMDECREIASILFTAPKLPPDIPAGFIAPEKDEI